MKLKLNRSMAMLLTVGVIVATILTLTVATFPGTAFAGVNQPEPISAKLVQRDNLTTLALPRQQASSPPLTYTDQLEARPFRASVQIQRPASVANNNTINSQGACTVELLIYEDFEDQFLDQPACWNSYDLNDSDGFTRTWGYTDLLNDTPFGSFSISPVAGGDDAVVDLANDGYPVGVTSLLEIGPFDLITATDALVAFSLVYSTELNDFMYLCATTDQIDYDCEYWSGGSGGWSDQAFWLSSYLFGLSPGLDSLVF